MTKARPCKVGQCIYPASKGRQFCGWHGLMRKSSLEQAEAARARLEAWNGKALVKRVDKSLWPEGERWCAGCQSFVPLFYTSGSRCRACASSANHAARLEREYQITREEYDRILRRQGGRCAICQNRSRTIRFAVDHDHQTGEVRGLLCKRCNHDLLGAGHDDIRLLWRAVRYLLSPPAQSDHVMTREEAIEALRVKLTLLAHDDRTRQRIIRDGGETQPPPF